MRRNYKATRPAWSALVQLEPGLRELEREARRRRLGPRFCANWAWYGPGGLKSCMSGLVGSLASADADPVLRSREAYDVAYEHLYWSLPDCGRDCRCRRVDRWLTA